MSQTKYRPVSKETHIVSFNCSFLSFTSLKNNFDVQYHYVTHNGRLNALNANPRTMAWNFCYMIFVYSYVSLPYSL